MAIYHPHRNVAPLIAAVRTWRDNCLFEDISLFAEGENVWTVEHLIELDTYFVQNLDDSDSGFLSKLQTQLEPASPGARRLAAEMLWVLLLFPSNITPAKKRETVATVWSWSGLELDRSHPLLADDVLTGVGHAGMGYNSFRWKELSWLIGFTRIIKRTAGDNRPDLFSDPWATGEMIAQVGGSGNRQFPLMLRYLLFPAQYERIATGRHKRLILAAIGDLSAQAAERLRDIALDRELYALRGRIAAGRGGDDRFDFYEAEFHERWRPSNAAWLLSWNPANWSWPDFVRDRRVAAAGTPVHAEWRCGATGPRVGDPVFLVKTGAEPRGLVARGRVVRPPFSGPHYDAARAARGDQTRFIGVEWLDIRDPVEDDFLSTQRLREVSADQQWSPQGSGIGISPPVHQVLEDAWAELEPVDAEAAQATKPAVAPAAPSATSTRYTIDNALEDVFLAPEAFERILRIWQRKKNIVLQGAPGVGKSFLARRLAYALIGRKDPDRVTTVQFHQSYGYEDFVQGYRPTGDGGFVLTDGVFTRFCEKARDNPDEDHVIVIDEINRGNLSKIFGELMLLIEPDKRGRDHAIQLAYARPDDPDFYLPRNLYVIGMMNTADRSLAVVDYALRRRFAFITVEPAFGTKAFSRALEHRGVPQEEIIRIVDGMTLLNSAIAADITNLGPGFRIGHSFFTPEEDAPWRPDWYETIMETEIRPLLEEYWFDDPGMAQSWIDRLLG